MYNKPDPTLEEQHRPGSCELAAVEYVWSLDLTLHGATSVAVTLGNVACGPGI